MPYAIGVIITLLIVWGLYQLFNYLSNKAKRTASSLPIRLDVDDLIDDLQKITSEFLYIDLDSHNGVDAYKIENEFTSFKKDILILCPVSDGIQHALELAILEIQNRKTQYFQEQEEKERK